MFADFFRAGDALVDRDRKFEAELGADGFGLFHDFANQSADFGIARHLDERGAGERTDGIKSDVAENLDPDFLSNARGDRAAQARGDQGFGDLTDSFRTRAVRFSERYAIAFGVANDARLYDFSGEINDRADDAPGVDRIRDCAAGIDAFEVHTFVIAAPSLKKPPGDSVLGADDCRVWAEDRFELRRELREAVGLYAEEDYVDRADFFEIPGDFRMRFEITLDTFHAYAALLHCTQMRTAGE